VLRPALYLCQLIECTVAFRRPGNVSELWLAEDARTTQQGSGGDCWRVLFLSLRKVKFSLQDASTSLASLFASRGCVDVPGDGLWLSGRRTSTKARLLMRATHSLPTVDDTEAAAEGVTLRWLSVTA
jgi:hypothetical protein